MKTSQAIHILMDYQKVNSGKKTIKNYRIFLKKFSEQFGEWDIQEISSENIFSFLVENCEVQEQTTKRFKYTLLNASMPFSISSVPIWKNLFPTLAIRRP